MEESVASGSIKPAQGRASYTSGEIVYIRYWKSVKLMESSCTPYTFSKDKLEYKIEELKPEEKDLTPT